MDNGDQDFLLHIGHHNDYVNHVLTSSYPAHSPME